MADVTRPVRQVARAFGAIATGTSIVRSLGAFGAADEVQAIAIYINPAAAVAAGGFMAFRYTFANRPVDESGTGSLVNAGIAEYAMVPASALVDAVTDRAFLLPINVYPGADRPYLILEIFNGTGQNVSGSVYVWARTGQR